MTHVIDADDTRTSHLGTQGFTLTEVLVVVAVLGIMAAVAVTVFGGAVSDVALEEAAHRVEADIVYARDRAIAHGTRHVLRFSDSGRRYEIADANGVLTHPVSKADYRVGIGEMLGGHSVTVSVSDLPGDSLSFAANGLPGAGGRIDLESGSFRWRIEVAESTGRVTVSQM